MLKVTETWLLFGSHIHQDFLLDHPDIISGIKEVYTFLAEPNKDELYRILSEINNGEYDTEFKNEFWEKSGADFFVVGKGINALLEKALAAIKSCAMSFRRKFRTILIVAGVTVLVLFLIDLIIVESCLEQGHRFDYSSYSCDDGSNQ